MTEKLRGVFIRWTEIREKLNRAALRPDAGTEAAKRELAELREQGFKLEGELVEALKAEPVGVEVTGSAKEDAESRERAALRAKAQVGAWVRAAISDSRLDGAEAEYAAAHGITDGRMPLDVVTRREERAVTPSPATTAIQQHAIVPALFDQSIAPWLGISMPTVPVGTPAYPYLATSVTASMLAKSAAAPETAGAFTVETAEPRRLSGAFRFTKEDTVRLSGLEEALRSNLSSVLSDKLDDQILNGDGQSPNLKGLLQELADPTAPASGDKTFAKWAERAFAHVDGLHATTVAGLRLLCGVKTYTTFASTFNTDETLTAADYLMDRLGAFRSTRRIGDPAANVQQAIIRMGMESGIVMAPVWMGVEFIRDPYSGAGKGEVVVTATTLVGGLAFTRKSAFAQTSFRLA